MRTRKAATLLVMAVCAVSALVAPALASAGNWSEKGVPVINNAWHWSKNGKGFTGPAIATFSGGSFNFSGGADCVLNGGLVISTEGWEPGAAASISIGSCKTKNTLKSLGCTSVKSVTPSFPNGFVWSGSFNSRKLVAKGVEIKYVFEGGAFCPKELTLTGDVTATPDNELRIKTLTFTGGLKSSVAGIEGTVTGSASLSPSGVYGIIGSNLVSLSGNVDFTLGQCTTNGLLEIGPGEDARVIAFDWSNCVGASWHKSCTVTAASENLPWLVHDETTTMRVKGFKSAETAKCSNGTSTPTYSGDFTAYPDDAGEIAKINFAEYLTGGGFNPYTTGTLNWSPAGQYGL